MAQLFGAPADTADTDTEDAPAPDTEAGESAEGEEQPTEVEAEAETEVEESAEVEEAPVAEAPPPRKLRIPKEDGTHEEVDEEEAIKGYMRREDYTRKRMAEAEREKEREAEFQRVREERQRYAEALPAIEAALKPEVPDWDKLRQESPEEFPAIYAAFQIRQQEYEKVRAEREKAQQQVAQDRAQALAKMLEEERNKLHQKLPELKQPENAKSLAKYLSETYGFTDEEINGTTRHELLVMAYKAKRFDEMEKAKTKIEQEVKAKIKPAKPGAAPSTKAKPTDFDKARARLKKTGDEKALAEIMKHVF